MADNKLLSKVVINGNPYDLKDAVARTKVETLIGSHAVEALGAAAWQAVAAQVADNSEGLVSAASVKSYVDAQVGSINKFDVKVVDSLPVNPGEDEMFIIYLMPHEHGASDVYDEYILVRSGDTGAYTYKFEKIGNTDIDLSGKVDKTATIAGIALNNGISAEELQTALGLKAFAYANKGTATVAAQTVQGVKATGTSTGSITGAMAYTATNIESTGKVTATGSVTGDAIKGGSIAVTLKDAEAATAATVTTEAYKPAGSVNSSFVADAKNGVAIAGTVSKPTATVTPATATVQEMKTAGTAYSITEGAVEKAADAKSAFATEGVVPTVDEANETLIFTAAGTSQAVTASGDVEYTAPVLSGALPTFGASAAVMTGATVDVSQPTFTGNKYAVNSSFAGTEVEDMKVTGVTYVKQAVNTATFTPVAATLGFSGDEVDVSVSGSYDKANKGTLAFAGADIELAVGDIAVPGQTVEVTPVSK